MRINTHQTRGITLIEMILALAIVSILAAAAAPAFGKLIQGGRAQSARSALIATLNTARMSAVGKLAHVGVCPSRDGEYCDRSTEWQGGWIAFVDADRDGRRGDGEAIVAAVQARTDVAIVSTAGRSALVYRADGSSAGSNVTLTVCDRRGAKSASTIVVNNAGRVRGGVPTPAAAAACLAKLG